MLNLLNLNIPITVNGVAYESSLQAYEALKDYEGEIVIQIVSNTASHRAEPVSYEEPEEQDEKINPETVYRIHVKKWMTEHSTPGFDLMLQLNGDVPMPMIIMQGNIIEETARLYKVKLHGVVGKVSHCLKCGKTLTHPVSKLYGIGPECGKHFHIHPFTTEEEFRQHQDEIAEKIRSITWEGLIPKSSVKSMKKVKS